MINKNIGAMYLELYLDDTGKEWLISPGESDLKKYPMCRSPSWVVVSDLRAQAKTVNVPIKVFPPIQNKQNAYPCAESCPSWEKQVTYPDGKLVVVYVFLSRTVVSWLWMSSYIVVVHLCGFQ